MKRRNVAAAAAADGGEGGPFLSNLVEKQEERVLVTLMTSRPGRRIRNIREFAATAPLPLTLFAFVKKEGGGKAGPPAWTHGQVEAALMTAYPGCIPDGHTICCISGHSSSSGQGQGTDDDPVYVKREYGLASPCIVARVVVAIMPPHLPRPTPAPTNVRIGKKFIK